MGEVSTVDKTLSSSADVNERFIAMRALGFRFGTNRDAAGMVVALVAARMHDGVIDIVQIYGEQDADATRISCHEPDILFPRAVFWRTTGSANQVIDALLDLADPAPNRGGRLRVVGATYRPGFQGRRSRTSDRSGVSGR
jgi:hypothetical protein